MAELRPLERVLERLDSVRERNGGEYEARCPVHDDRRPSLSIREAADGQVLIHCFARCRTENVIRAIGLSMSDLFAQTRGDGRNGGAKPSATWRIRNPEGVLQAEHVRYDRGDGDKDCFWRLPGSNEWGLAGRKLRTLPLYRCDSLRDWPKERQVIIVEGEPAADALASFYQPVVATVTGADVIPEKDVLEVLRERRAVLWCDNDEPGRRHMRDLAARLLNVAKEVRIFEWADAPPKGDAADWAEGEVRDDHQGVEGFLARVLGAPVLDERTSYSSPKADGIEYGGAKPPAPGPRAVPFKDLPDPGERRHVVEGLIPEAYPAILHGDGGVAKSMLALSLATAVASDAESWLGRRIGTGPAIFLDFELDATEQRRRAHQLARGSGYDRPPDDLLYIGALGHPTRAAFDAALMECRERRAKLLILDSLGPALQGDAETARDVIGFYREVLEPFRVAGCVVLAIDHQSKLQPGQSYRDKSAFGSVYKTNLARSVVQAEAVARGDDALIVRLRHRKFNFGSLATPIEAEIKFGTEKVIVEAVETGAADPDEERGLRAPDRVLLALSDAPSFPNALSKSTGLALQTVKNSLSKLRKQSFVEDTGERRGKAEKTRITNEGRSYLRTYIHKGGVSEYDERKARALEVIAAPERGPRRILASYLAGQTRLEYVVKSVLRDLGEPTED